MSRLSLLLMSSATERWTQSDLNDDNDGCTRVGAAGNQTIIWLVDGLRRQTGQSDRSNEKTQFSERRQ